MMDDSYAGRDGKRMILIPAGEFTMGTCEADLPALASLFRCSVDRFRDETPEHCVFIDAFYIDETPVTNADYERFLDANPDYPTPPGWDKTRRQVSPRQPDHPVVNVSWENAQAYAHWAGKELPTEAQWEKAARGTDRRIYPWGDEFDPRCCNTWEVAIFTKTPVMRYAPRGNSPYGVIDMAGNACEWCADWYAADYYRHSPSPNPMGPETGIFRVLRGGAWSGDRVDLRTAKRHFYYPRYRDVTLGFRCVMYDG